METANTDNTGVDLHQGLFAYVGVLLLEDNEIHERYYDMISRCDIIMRIHFQSISLSSQDQHRFTHK